jgi:hypothetical protein
MDPKTRNIRRLIDNSRNHIKLIWVPSHVEIGVNEAADQAAKDALNKEISNEESYSPQDLMKYGWKKGSPWTDKKYGKEMKTIWNTERHQ